MSTLTLELAERLTKSALSYARSKSLNPLSIAVVDNSGNLKSASREDGAGMVGVDIALGKARAALAFNCSSRQIADALSGNALAGPSVLAVLQGRIVLLAGGIPVHESGGAIIGAIAAAGDSPDNDELTVQFAVKALSAS